MDEETKAWCEASGLTGNTVKSLADEEFFSMQALRATTVDVIAGLSLSSAQRCLLKKAVLKAQSAAPPSLLTGATKESGQLVQDLDALESSILALSQNKADVVSETAHVGQGKNLKTLPRAHEAVYLKPRGGKPDSKITPLDLSYSEFIAGYFSILDGLMQNGEHTQAQMLCRYLKFLSKKSIAFSTSAILQFDDEFRGMVARGEATYDDHSSLNELQAHHFDSSAVKASNSRPRDRGRPRASPLPTGSSKSFGKHGYKWNEDPHNCGGGGGAITLTRVSCATPLSTVPCFIVPNPPIRKNHPPIDHIHLLRQRPIHPFQMVLLHGSRPHFLLTRICTVYVLSRDISTLGAANWPLTPSTKISFFRVLRMAFILSTTYLLFPPRTVRII